MITYINDTINSPGTFLCYTFDSNNNSAIDVFDKADLMFANNDTQTATPLPGGPILLPSVWRHRSEFHTCTFNGQRYVYNATYSKPPRDLVQLIYQRPSGDYICVMFYIGW